MQRNRDYWSKPIQSDRNAPNYGHTMLSPERAAPSRWGWLVVLLAGSLLVIFGGL